MKKTLLVSHVFSLLLGALIYVLFRDLNLKMFSWYRLLGLSDIIDGFRELTNSLLIPNWILYSLPDGLWLFSYMCIMLFIWKNIISSFNILWFLILPVIALLSEIGQLMGVLPGVFDWVDILSYVIGIFVPIVLFKVEFNLNQNIMNKKLQSLASILVIGAFSFIAFGSLEDDKNISSETNYESTSTANESVSPEKKEVIEKLRDRAKKDWPNDFVTQEYWINEQIEAYDYMLGIEDNSIKKQAQRDWPLDFVTQKYWYNEQIEARDRLN